MELSLVVGYPDLAVENRTRRIQFDQDGDEEEEGRDQDEADGRRGEQEEREIFQALPLAQGDDGHEQEAG